LRAEGQRRLIYCTEASNRKIRKNWKRLAENLLCPEIYRRCTEYYNAAAGCCSLAPAADIDRYLLPAEKGIVYGDVTG